MKHKYYDEKIDREKVIERFEGWLAYASNADTYKYRQKMTSKFNLFFPSRQEINQEEIKITSVRKHENFNHKIEISNIEFSQQKTLQLIKKGMTVEQIAEARGIKEGTAWGHVANLVENHQLTLKSMISNHKIKTILLNIKSTFSTPSLFLFKFAFSTAAGFMSTPKPRFALIPTKRLTAPEPHPISTKVWFEFISTTSDISLVSVLVS